MKYLSYTILGKNRQIECNEINDNKNIVKINDDVYNYKNSEEEQETFKKLLNILDLWNKFTTNNNIMYWACGGTLLGAIRHNGFIPWDNDLDVCILLSDFEKIKKVLDNQNVLKYIECECGFKIYIDNTFPFLDVFICDYYDENTIKYAGFILDDKPTWFISDLYPKDKYLKTDLFPLTKVPFENITVMVPNNSKNILYPAFSNNCLLSCKISSHTMLHKLPFLTTDTGPSLDIIKNIYKIEKFLNIPREKTVTSLLFKYIDKFITDESIHKEIQKILDIKDIIDKILK